MIDNRPHMDATGGAARTADIDGRGGDHTTEGGGGVRPLSLRVHHMGCEQYLNIFLMIFQRTVYGMAVCVKSSPYTINSSIISSYYFQFIYEAFSRDSRTFYLA